MGRNRFYKNWKPMIPHHSRGKEVGDLRNDLETALQRAAEENKFVAWFNLENSASGGLQSGGNAGYVYVPFNIDMDTAEVFAICGTPPTPQVNEDTGSIVYDAYGNPSYSDPTDHLFLSLYTIPYDADGNIYDYSPDYYSYTYPYYGYYGSLPSLPANATFLNPLTGTPSENRLRIEKGNSFSVEPYDEDSNPTGYKFDTSASVSAGEFLSVSAIDGTTLADWEDVTVVFIAEAADELS